MRGLLLVLLLGAGTAWAQSSAPPAKPAPSDADQANPKASKAGNPRSPNLAPPRSDSVNVNSLGNEPGESSSKDTQIDLSPPAGDEKAHPQSSDAMLDAEMSSGGATETHPWDPHRAAKDVEVGDFYFKRKNYRAAEDRYREALFYKDNDAIATFRLAVCLEKLNRPEEAQKEYESYLAILPHGPQAEESQKAIDRLKGPRAAAKPEK